MSYSSQIKTVFSGPSSSTNPPHNGLAVGSNYIVMVEGSQIEWTNLAGGSPTVESTYNFFSSLSPTGGLYDQRCFWDPVNQRYIVIMQYEATGASDIDIAISKDSNPNDGWYFSQLNTSPTINGQVTGSDRPMLAIDGSNIYITAAQYNVNGSAYDGTEFWTIGDTVGTGGGVYNGGTLTVTANQLASPSQGIYAVAAGNNGKTYYASDYSNGSQIVVALQIYNTTTNTFGPITTVALGNIDQGGGYTAQQLGTSLLLDAGDRRIASMVYANGFLYAVAVMEAPGASVPSVHWFEIDVSNPNAPNLVAQGNISGAAIGTNVGTFNPSIAVDASGDVIINFTASGPNMYPGDYYVFQGGRDPTGAFSAPILYQASTGFFNSGATGVQRWGVNSSATVDPNNPNSFWISNEYVASGWWQTSVAQIAIQNPAIVMVSSIVTSGTGITGGGGDLNAGHLVTLTVNFTGTVTVNTTGGAPTLTLNDGGTAAYIGGSGSSALTFGYTVAGGQNIPDLGVSAFNLNGATVTDGSGNTADVSGAINLNPAGTLVIDTTAPVPAFSQEPQSTTSSNTAVFGFTTSNSETGGVSYAYELDGATTWTTVNGNALSLSGLAVGSHVIKLQATDGAGNVSASPASYSWTVTPPAAQIKTQFFGISVTGTYPPNNGLAVGPNYIVTMEASRIEWTNLTGGSPVVQSVYSFFSPLGSSADNSLNHPRVVYDSVNQRYIMIMDNNASGHTISTIDIAVSKDSNPNDGWYLAALNTSITINGQLTAADSPTIAVDGTNIYITATQYNVNVSGTAGTEAWVIGDTAGAGGGIYNGGTLTVVANEVLPASQSIFTAAAGNNGNTYYASDYSSGGQTVIALQTYNATTNTFGATSTIGLGNIDQGGSYTAQQLGTSLLLNAGDNRARSLVYANGFLYGVAEFEPIGSSVPEVHWFKINVSNPNAPTLAAQGDISGAAIGTNVATFNGSMAVDASGDVLINFVASGPNMYPADYYVYQKGSDPVGSFSAPILYQASTGFFNSGATGVQSWGNYSTAIVDPNNPNSFWISNQYVANNWWQTSVAQIASVTGLTLTSIVTSGTGITNGNGDLNAGHVVTLTVNFSTAVTVNTTGGAPTLTLSDSGTATYTGGSGSTALTFSYTVAAGQNTPDLVVSSLNLNGATMSDGAGNAADLSGATNYNPAGVLQVDTTAPAAPTSLSLDPSTDSGTQGDGITNFTQVKIDGTAEPGSTVTLYDSNGTTVLGTGTANATTGAFGITTSALASGTHSITATATDPAGNVSTASTAYTVTIDTSAPAVTSIVTSGAGITNGNGDLGVGQTVTLTVNFSAAVTVNTTGGTPTLTLNDSGTATYTGGSGSTALTFSYAVAAGQNTPDLVVSSFNLNGATISDVAANNASLSGATNYNPAGILQIGTVAPTVASIVPSGTGITSGSGDLNAGHVVTLTVNFSTAVTVNTTGGAPTLTLNDSGTATYTGGSGSTALTFGYTVAAGQNTPDLVVSSFNLNGATVTDGAGNAANLSGATNYNPAGILQIDTVAPTVTSIATSGTGITNGSGDLNAGHLVTLTVNFGAAVTVNTTGGTPTLTLNDSGAATYTGGSGSTALTFSYTVAAGQNTPDLVVSSLNLNGATMSDGAGDAADLSGATNYNPAGVLQVDTTAPAAPTSLSLDPSTDSGTQGDGITNFTQVKIDGTAEPGSTVTLYDSNGTTVLGTGTANATTGAFGITTSALASGTHSITATATDPAGNVSTASTAYTVTIDTSAPAVTSIVTSGAGITNGNGDLGVGQTVTLTVNFSAAVTVNTTGGTPTLTLNDSGTATYTGGSGSTALTFSYAVAAGQNTADIVISSFNLNGATVTDGTGNAANLTGATNYNPAGILQIDTVAPTVASIVPSGAGITSGSGDLNAGHVVTLTVNFSTAVTVNSTGGAPTLTLNDSGTATYTGGSGSTALTFSYTVAAGQNTPDLVISLFNLNGATVTDGAGNAADLSGATNYNPSGALQIDTTAPVPAFSQEPQSVSNSNAAVFAFTTSNSETGGVSYAYELDGTTTWTPVSGNTLSLSGLPTGSHVIQLQATDGAGNVSASPASYNWTVAPAAAQIETQFSGISVMGTYPPNNALAVGPNYIVMMEASRIEWTNLTGGSPVLQSVYSFFSPLGSSAASSLNHPRAIYDSVNQRYIMIMDNNASGHTISNIDIAVSKDSNPNDGWYLASLNTSITIDGQLTAADTPTIAVDGTNIYITATQYNVNVSGTAGTEAWVIGDTAGAGGGIYDGGTLTVVANEVLPASQSIFTAAAGNNGNTYYASDYSNGSQMVVVLQSYNATTNTFGATSTISLGNIDQGGSYTAQQLGTSLLLNAGDKRTRSLVYANGFLYGVAEFEPIGSSVPEVHWFKINVSNPNAPTLAAQGDISGAAIGTNVATFNGSMAVDASGDVLINFVASGPNMYPADYYVYQKGSDPVGSFSAPILYQASTGFFNSGATGVQSWGNYSTATVDPNNPNSFWISNQYVANGWWQTSVAQVAIEAAEAPTLTIANTSLNVTAGGSVALGITASPVDSDDTISVTISGVPTYETVTAPSGDTVTSSLQADGTNTWTITEGSSTTGKPLTGLTLTSQYTGTGHPIATLTVTAINTTSGETAASASQTMAVTDPPATTSGDSLPGPAPSAATVASIQDPWQIGRLLALMDQFAAAGFHREQTGAGAIDWTRGAMGSDANVTFLAPSQHRLV